METRDSSPNQKSDVGKLRLAVFDFDGTITKCDTFLSFSWFACGAFKFTVKTLLAIPGMISKTIRTGSLSPAKEVWFGRLFRGRTEEEFRKLGELYSRKRLPHLIRQEAVEKINWHKEQGDILVILSASIVTWITPWARENNIPYVIATEPEVVAGRLTGNFLTPNCVGEEKAKRLLDVFPDLSKYEVYGYGDSRKDKSFLKLADHPMRRSF